MLGTVTTGEERTGDTTSRPCKPTPPHQYVPPRTGNLSALMTWKDYFHGFILALPLPVMFAYIANKLTFPSNTYLPPFSYGLRVVEPLKI